MRSIALLRTLAAAIVIPLYVLIVGPPALLWALVSRNPSVLFTVGAAGVRLGFAIAGLKLRVVGVEHIQPGGTVYAANHSSNIDPPALFVALERLFPRVAVLYKAELRRLPVLVWAFDLGGMALDGQLGLRGVHANRDLHGTQRVDTPAGFVFDPVSDSSSETYWLPNFNATLHFTRELQLRLAATKTRTRPQFLDLNPSISIGRPPSGCDPTITNCEIGASGGPKHIGFGG